MTISAIASTVYNVIMAVNAFKKVFFAVQELYYDNLFESLSTERNDIKGRRRALSNSIENASSDDDRRQLSIMLAELQSNGRKQKPRKTRTTS
jgi:hypothetical protein